MTVIICKLDAKGSNFQKWKKETQIELANIGARRVLDADFKPACSRDVTDQDKAWALLTRMLDDKIQHLFEGTKSAAEIFAKAEQLFGSKDPMKYRDKLSELKAMKFVGGSIEGHIAEVSSKIAALRAYTNDLISPAQELVLLSETLGDFFNDIKARIL